MMLYLPQDIKYFFLSSTLFNTYDILERNYALIMQKLWIKLWKTHFPSTMFPKLYQIEKQNATKSY